MLWKPLWDCEEGEFVDSKPLITPTPTPITAALQALPKLTVKAPTIMLAPSLPPPPPPHHLR